MTADDTELDDRTRTAPRGRTRTDFDGRTRTARVPRTRGAVSGALLVLLGAWGALVPFIGPYFDYSFGSDQTWHWTNARGWLEVLPGAAVVVGGWLVLISKHRVSGSLGGWLAAAGGAWFVVGQSLARLWHTGSVGTPLSTRDAGRAVAQLGYFYGLGVVIVFLAAFALGRLAVVGVRDLQAARRDEERAAEQARAAELERQRQVDEELRNRQAAEAAAAEQARVADRPAAGTVAEERAADRGDEQRTAVYPAVDERAPATDAAEGRAAETGPRSYDPDDGRTGYHAPSHSADQPSDGESNPYDTRG
ncbi:MAG TPA: hypothetical protein VH298_02990 [Jatrophihabitans sp.]|nr:hypothetical protein [Jatrophihabitans sp.]